MTATTLGADWALDWIERARAVVSANRIGLIELDRAIGDGDHGENMDRGFTAVGAKLAGATPSAPGGGAQDGGHHPDVDGGRRRRAAVRHRVPARVQARRRRPGRGGGR
nr:hypothetical protein DA06_15275 [Georgenia sp. SUBG003]